MKLINIIRQFFKGDVRTVRVKKNVFASIGLKGIDSIVYLLLVPVTLGYLNPYEYGIWLTLNSVLMWINSFDIGLGNGLRNKLAEAIAKGNKELGKIYVSTTFIMLIAIMGVLILVGAIFEPLVDWYGILGTSTKQVPRLNQIVYTSFSIYCINFIFKFIGNVYLAMQLPAVNNLMTVSGHLLSLIIIYILTLYTEGSLLWVAVIYCTSPLLVYLIAYPVTFFKIYPFLRPSFKDFKIEYLKDLFNIGIKFFFLQLSAILLFAFSNLLISHMFGPNEVTPYNIAYRYFSLVPMVMNLIIAPMWSATTDAYNKGDIEWIKKSKKGIHKILLLSIVIIALMIAVSSVVYKIWIGNKVHIPFLMSALMGMYVCIIIYSLSYSSFLNGLGKLRVQTINTVTVAILFIPLCYLFGKKLGVMGIVLGMCILNSTGLILNYIQYNLVISNKAKGIWAK